MGIPLFSKEWLDGLFSYGVSFIDKPAAVILLIVLCETLSRIISIHPIQEIHYERCQRY